MGRSPQAERLISEAEAAVVERLLTAGGHTQHQLIESIRALVVVERCECGCASVDFAIAPSNTHPATAFVEGSGLSATGEELGIIIFANGECISGLEVFSYSDVPAPLPVLASISAAPPGDAA